MTAMAVLIVMMLIAKDLQDLTVVFAVMMIIIIAVLLLVVEYAVLMMSAFTLLLEQTAEHVRIVTVQEAASMTKHKTLSANYAKNAKH